MNSDEPTSAYSRYRVLWPDHLGLARGKYLPARSASGGTSFSIGVFLQSYDRVLYDVSSGIDSVGLPDLDAVYDLERARPGWEPGTGIVIADLVLDDEPFETSPRQVLRRAIEAWRDQGFSPVVGFELEAYLLHLNEEDDWVPVPTPSSYLYGTGAHADSTGVIDEIMEKAEASGIPIESVNGEFDVPQFELTLEFADALTAVDNAFLFKELAREVAHGHGLKLTFMGKPVAEKAGSGLHINLSMADDQGNNAFADDSEGDGLSKLARQVLAGLLDHHEALTAMCAPTVNAYKRLVAGEFVGQWANWGYDHRAVAVRVPPQRGLRTRLEHRLSDGSANPYLATAAILQAGLLGVEDYLYPEEAETGDGLSSRSTERRCPETLGAAVEALLADTALVNAVGADAVNNFCDHKTIEWRVFTEVEPHWRDKSDMITAWEYETYLPFH